MALDQIRSPCLGSTDLQNSQYFMDSINSTILCAKFYIYMQNKFMYLNCTCREISSITFYQMIKGGVYDAKED